MSDRKANSRVPVEERLFSLILALLATRNGLTKSEILSTVHGYSQKYSPSGDNSALERQFQRDKDDIRELGVPLETFEPLGEEGNNQSTRYRILPAEYELPRDIRFSRQEASLLNLAALVWREGALSGESRRALLKFKSLGVEIADPVLDYIPRSIVREPSFEPLREALEKNLVTEFDYFKPGETESTHRQVLPLALIQFQGRWHLYAMDANSQERKTFLLRRIVSEIATGSKVIAPPREDSADVGLKELQAVWDRNLAQIRVQPGTDAEVRLLQQQGAKRLDNGLIELHFVDLHILADELAAYGPEVLVESPSELREQVKARLAEVLKLHPVSTGQANGR
ncbi:MAG: WYL domain-containing protein [Microbacteriaceae bacterium]|nr:WYL domain-containing protein [Cryobacterium sp.]MBX3103881.1 WYL domain-containing protein [Cryobacterium sp.]MCC6375593.1 WYL domain-containing protein [Microbacteriaceae bacterium]